MHSNSNRGARAPGASRRVPVVTARAASKKPARPLSTRPIVSSGTETAGSIVPQQCGTSAAMATRAVAYLRVSTDVQAEEGLGLEVQRGQTKTYAALYNLDLVAVVEDAGASAASLNRPGLHSALGMLADGAADALLVARLDRLTRSVRDLGDLVQRYFAAGRWALLSVGEQIDTRSAAGRLILNVLGSVAQWERERIAERTSAAMRIKVAHGEYTGGLPPYGYSRATSGGMLVPVDNEQRIIEAARGLRAGGASLREISRELARRGWLSRAGRRFAAGQVARLLDAGRRDPAPTAE